MGQKPIKLTVFEGGEPIHVRSEALYDKIMNLLYDEYEGLPVPTVVGVLEIAKRDVLRGTDEDD